MKMETNPEKKKTKRSVHYHLRFTRRHLLPQTITLSALKRTSLLGYFFIAAHRTISVEFLFYKPYLCLFFPSKFDSSRTFIYERNFKNDKASGWDTTQKKKGAFNLPKLISSYRMKFNSIQSSIAASAS